MTTKLILLASHGRCIVLFASKCLIPAVLVCGFLGCYEVQGNTDPLPRANKLVGNWLVEQRVYGGRFVQGTGGVTYDAMGGYAFKGAAALSPTGPVKDIFETGTYTYDDVTQSLTTHCELGTATYQVAWHGADEFHVPVSGGVQVYKRVR
jgi:hypothetical protein